MTRFLKLLSISSLVLIFALSSCKTKVSKQGKVSSSGKTSEILVVLNDVHWNAELGDSLKEFFGQPYPGTNTDEPLFEIFRINMVAFGELFQTHRNILNFDIDKKYTRGKLDARRDVWSQPQVVVQITAPDRASALEQFMLNKENILQLFEDMESIRIQNTFKSTPNYPVIADVKKHFGFNLPIPVGYATAIEQDSFLWLRLVTNDFDQNIMIYSYPYTDTNAFQLDRIIKNRNLITEQYVHGKLDSTWMIVAPVYPPDHKIINFKGNYGALVNGLWELENDFMGGPFLSYTFLDEKTKRIITLDGAVYYPSKPKRDHLRQLDGIFKGLEYITDSTRVAAQKQ